VITRVPEPATGGDVDLLISDIDGTLVTLDKHLTSSAAAAVLRLADAGIAFTLVSSRPPRGMRVLVEKLDIRLPFGAFNGGSLVARDMTVFEAHRLARNIAHRMLSLLAERKMEAWVYTGADWRLRDPDDPNVAREILTIGFHPTVVTGFEDVIDRIDKIVGVSSDHALLACVESEVQALAGKEAAVARSQPYYLDITHPLANKGHAVISLCKHIGVDPRRTAVIGDGFNDVPMFKKGGFSIAMGQAPDAVKDQAAAVTLSNSEDGFASAVARFVLPRGPDQRAHACRTRWDRP
jgi:Cof subfamily protein (haloacid dehalogenase superfamily)